MLKKSFAKAENKSFRNLFSLLLFLSIPNAIALNINLLGTTSNAQANAVNSLQKTITAEVSNASNTPFLAQYFSGKRIIDYSTTVLAVKISPDNKTLYSADNEGKIKIWDLETEKQIGELLDPQLYQCDRSSEQECLSSRTQAHKKSILSIALSPDGQTLVSGDNEQIYFGSETDKIKVWNLATGKLDRVLETKSRSGVVSSLAISPDGQMLASGDWNGIIKIWNLATGEYKFSLKGHSNLISSVAIHPDGKTLISSSSDTWTNIWDLVTGQRIGSLTAYVNAAKMIAISPDGRYLAKDTRRNTIEIWDLDNRKKIQTLYGHADRISSLVIYDNTTLLSGGYDGTIYIWNLKTGERQGVLKELITTNELNNNLNIEENKNKIYSIAVSSNGKTIVGAGEKGIIIWKSTSN